MRLLRSIYSSVRQRARRTYVHLLRAPGAPSEVALGMAIGAFVAMLPIFGVQMGVAVAIVELLRRVTGIRASRVAAATGVWITNPLTAAPLYGLCVLIGRPLARLSLELWKMEAPDVVLDGTSVAALGLLEGGVILGMVAAAVGYKLTYQLVSGYQRRRATRLRERALRALRVDPASVPSPPLRD